MEEHNIEYIPEFDKFEIQKDMKMKVVVPNNEFGDATIDDVVAGKTFTSKNGLNLMGNMKSGNSVNISTIIIPAGRMKGDVNYDGIVNYIDAGLINGNKFNDEESKLAADINDNGISNSIDATFINQSIIPKYKLTKYSMDIRNKWIMREDFIAEPNKDFDWIFSAEMAVPGVTQNSTVKIIPKNFAEASKCGMNSHIVLDDGKIIFYTLRPPKEDVECLIEIFEDGDGTGVFVVATDPTFQPKPEEIGAAKCETIVLTLDSAQWYGDGPYDYDIEDERIKSTSVGIIGVIGNTANQEVARESRIVVLSSSDGCICLSAKGVKPAQNIRCQLILLADNGGKIMGCFPG